MLIIYKPFPPNSFSVFIFYLRGITLTPGYVTKEECGSHRNHICETIKNECTGVKSDFRSELALHDAQAKALIIDVKRIEDTLRETADIVKETALLQKRAEEREARMEESREKRDMMEKQKMWNLIYRLITIGGVIVIAFFGIKIGEYIGIIEAAGF